MEQVYLGSPRELGNQGQLGKGEAKFVLNYRISCHELHRHLGDPQYPLRGL